MYPERKTRPALLVSTMHMVSLLNILSPFYLIATIDSSDGLFSPVSYEVASTVNQYNTLFCSEYKVNTDDTMSKIPGVLYGRYQGDTYAGGNPWVLSTAALANLFYRGAVFIASGQGVPDAKALSMWQKAFNSPTALSSDSSTLAKTFAIAGDSVLARFFLFIFRLFNIFINTFS